MDASRLKICQCIRTHFITSGMVQMSKTFASFAIRCAPQSVFITCISILAPEFCHWYNVIVQWELLLGFVYSCSQTYVHIGENLH